MRTSILIVLLLAFLVPGEGQSGASDSVPPNHDPKHYLKIGGKVLPPRPLGAAGSANASPCQVNRQGTVVLWIGINEKGTVDVVRVVRSADHELDQKAIDAVKQWKFASATKEGLPVPVQTNVEVNFKLC